MPLGKTQRDQQSEAINMQ